MKIHPSVKLAIEIIAILLNTLVNTLIYAVKLGIDGGLWRLTRFWSQPQVVIQGTF